MHEDIVPKTTCTYPLSKQRNRRDTERDQVDSGHHLEQFAEDMGDGPVAGRCHVDLAGIGLGVGDELRDRLSWNGWIDHHDIRAAANARDRRNVADEIEIELFAKRRVYRARQANKQERIAVRRCPHDGFGADLPPAPVRFSMTNGCPSRSDSD
jgi:hypothetical protein